MTQAMQSGAGRHRDTEDDLERLARIAASIEGLAHLAPGSSARTTEGSSARRARIVSGADDAAAART